MCYTDGVLALDPLVHVVRPQHALRLLHLLPRRVVHRQRALRRPTAALYLLAVRDDLLLKKGHPLRGVCLELIGKLVLR